MSMCSETLCDTRWPFPFQHATVTSRLYHGNIEAINMWDIIYKFILANLMEYEICVFSSVVRFDKIITFFVYIIIRRILFLNTRSIKRKKRLLSLQHYKLFIHMMLYRKYSKNVRWLLFHCVVLLIRALAYHCS